MRKLVVILGFMLIFVGCKEDFRAETCDQSIFNRGDRVKLKLKDKYGTVYGLWKVPSSDRCFTPTLWIIWDNGNQGEYDRSSVEYVSKTTESTQKQTPQTSLSKTMFKVKCREINSKTYKKQMVNSLSEINFPENVAQCELRKVEINYVPVEEEL